MATEAEESVQAPSVVLVVSGIAERRDQMLKSCRESLPSRRVEALGEFSALVRRLAGNGIAMVLLDLPGLPDLVEAAPVVLRGLGPHARLVAVHDDDPDIGAPGLMVSDKVPLHELRHWLSSLGHSGDAANAGS